MIFQSFSHNSLAKDVEKSQREQTALSDSDCGSDPVSYFAIKVDCTRGLVVEVLGYDSDQVGVNVIKRNRRSKSFVPYSIKRLFKINKDVIES